MALNKLQQGQIKSLMKDERWDAVVRFVGFKLEQWRNEPVNGENAFQELRTLHNQRGKIEGVTEFFDQLERQAFE